MKVAILSSITWRTPPRNYGPWELVASNLTEALVEKGIDVTLFATKDSITRAKLIGTCVKPLAETEAADIKVEECLHISELFERADEFDIIHNHFDFPPLAYSKIINTPVLTTIHGFSSSSILPVYKKYDAYNFYVSISNANRHPDLTYCATVYNGINISEFNFSESSSGYLLFFGRIHPEKGTYEAIQLAKRCRKKLIIAGLIQDQEYFLEKVLPFLDDKDIKYVGNCEAAERQVLLGNAMALLHLISFDEPFGLSVVESMCCGTPVIAFNRGSMPEIIINERTGFLINSIDQAAAAVEKIGSIKRQQCRSWVEAMFSKEKMADQYLSIYKKILQIP